MTRRKVQQRADRRWAFGPQARVKGWGKSPPPAWQQGGHGKPLREQDQIGRRAPQGVRIGSIEPAGRLLEVDGDVHPRGMAPSLERSKKTEPGLPVHPWPPQGGLGLSWDGRSCREGSRRCRGDTMLSRVEPHSKPSAGRFLVTHIGFANPAYRSTRRPRKGASACLGTEDSAENGARRCRLDTMLRPAGAHIQRCTAALNVTRLACENPAYPPPIATQCVAPARAACGGGASHPWPPQGGLGFYLS